MPGAEQRETMARMGVVKEPVATLYDTDFHAWTQEQADLLRRREWRGLDIAHLSEEIESMGNQQQAELTNRLAVLLAHLYKWQAQPDERPMHGRSWRLTIAEQRRQIDRLMSKNPSLAPYAAEAMRDAWGDARLIVARETRLDEEAIPVESPFDWRGARSADWMPA